MPPGPPPAGRPGQPPAFRSAQGPTGPSGTQVTGTPVTASPHGGTGATGVFPAAYVARPEQGPPRGYAPEQEPGRGRRQPPPGPRPRRIIDYPRWGRTGFTRWLPSWKLIAGLIATGFITMCIGLFAAYSATSLPPEDAQASAQTSVIYFNDGTTPIGQLATQNRQNVDFAQIPRHVRLAVLAAEDRTFYTNSGVDPTSIARAVYSNVRGNSLQGGSTISQQYVKNVYDQRDRSYKRKAKEVFLAIKINRQLDKDKILERYLNTIYLGRGAYGIQAASHAYFGEKTDVSELTVSQGAFLAGIINAPSLADPRGGPEEKARAERRWGVVLDAMVADKLLDPTTRASLKFPPTVKLAKSVVTVKGQNGYLMDMVVKEATQRLNITEGELKTKGYKIVSTFNKRMVDAGAQAVKEMLPKDKPKKLQIGMASIDPSTGAVRAIYGGAKYVGRENNNATISIAEAGSTFKAFGLVAALDDGMSLKTQYNGKAPFKLKGEKKPINNFDGEQFGYIDLVKATQHSVNTVYVRMNIDVGPEKMEEAAYKLGIPESLKIGRNTANVLGSAAPHAIDMASAYATIAAEGVHRSPYTIQKVSLLGTRETVWDMAKRTKGERVYDADIMADATFALQSVVDGGTAPYAAKLGRPVAGKTGTSSDSRSAWFVGFTPQLSTSVMMYQLGTVNGQPGNVAMEGFGEFRSVFGGGYPARIWTEYMIAAMRNKEEKSFPPPAFTGEILHRAPVKPTPTVTQQPTQQPTQPPPPTRTQQPAPPTQTQQPDNPGQGGGQPTQSSRPPLPTFTQPTEDDDDNNNDGNGNNN